MIIPIAAACTCGRIATLRVRTGRCATWIGTAAREAGLTRVIHELACQLADHLEESV